MMPPKSKIDLMPPHVRKYIEEQLANPSITLDALLDGLRAHFPDDASVSRSALGRYKQNFDRVLDAVRASKAAALLIQHHAGDDRDARSGAVTSILQTHLMDCLLQIDGQDANVSPEDRLTLFSNAAKNIASLTRSSVALKDFQSKVDARVQQAAEAVDAIVKESGLNAQSASQIKARILGISGSH